MISMTEVPIGYAYTLGLHDICGFELIIFGNCGESFMFNILYRAAAGLKRNKNMLNNREVTGIIKLRGEKGVVDARIGCKYIAPDVKGLLFWADKRYGKFEAKQVLLPDKEGFLPWEERYDENWGKQMGQALLYLLPHELPQNNE